MTPRFQQAIEKLYNAFHAGQLHPECCQQCAVGTILDGTSAWRHLSDAHGSLKLNYVGLVNQNLHKTFNGYTPLELLQIEAAFLKGCGYSLPLHHQNKKPNRPADQAILFNGLEAVVAFLCSLEGIANGMDCTSLFQYTGKEAIPAYS
jgi:hypothetical protein